MSNDNQKADQIALHFYTKLFYVVSDARTTAESRLQSKVDKWFNLETHDSDMFPKEIRDKYKSVSMYPPPPPLEIQVLLSVPELSSNQVLVYLSPDSSRVQLKPTPKYILLESWVLAFNTRRISEDEGSEVALSTVYKHGIPLFRSLYSLLRILPTWKLCKRLRRRGAGNGNLNIQLRVRTQALGDSGPILGFDTSPATGASPLPSKTHVFAPVSHPMGTLSLSATYLTTPHFRVDDLESLLSSRFLSEGPEFVPTLTKNLQRDSITGSPGSSLPIRTSLPRSPPISTSIADRFVLPSSSSRPQSIISGSPRNIPLPPGSTSGSFTDNSSRPPSGLSLAARLRKESTGPSSTADLPSAPLAIRRPSINPVHPFKTNTLASASPSGGSLGGSSASFGGGVGGSLSSVGIANLPTLGTTRSPTMNRQPAPLSPIGLATRPSPPFAPSSLRSEESDSPKLPPPPRKRYSSSFGHRYAPSLGAGSEGSGSGNEKVGSASFLSTNTDDDEISTFVQDIDARKPLSGRHRLHSQSPRQAFPELPRPQKDEGGLLLKQETISPPGAMLTSEGEVDEKLRKMNETFLASLEGLGGIEGSIRRKKTDSPESRGRESPTGLGMRGFVRPRYGSAASQGSEEVIGKMEFDDDRRRG
ncbi:autophagy-related protein 13-domain-containing protein [Armillaria luteobubalina]|uniref:Autophagy-related protein 13 n=1 Tax=Armillaria luteobubalina TaxID=153913 RepID=A0AA39PZQ8_9AGAR|nr:autophagy-related protein 13-domain-containing protein [Armillaria luteobubalina]